MWVFYFPFWQLFFALDLDGRTRKCMYWCNFLAHHSPIHCWFYIPLSAGENRAVKEHKQCFLISWLVFQLFWKKLIFGVNLRFRRLRFCLCKEQRQYRGAQFTLWCSQSGRRDFWFFFPNPFWFAALSCPINQQEQAGDHQVNEFRPPQDISL